MSGASLTALLTALTAVLAPMDASEPDVTLEALNGHLVDGHVEVRVPPCPVDQFVACQEERLDVLRLQLGQDDASFDTREARLECDDGCRAVFPIRASAPEPTDWDVARPPVAEPASDTPLPAEPQSVPTPDLPDGLVLATVLPAAVAVAVGLAPWPRLAALWSGPWRRILSIATAACAVLYSRIEDDSLLDNGTRKCLHDLIASVPGQGIQELRDRAGIAWGTAVYHLERLEKAGLVVSHRHGNHRLYFLANTPEARSKASLGVLSNETARRLAFAVLLSPGASQRDLCQQVGIRHPVASKHLQRLEKHSLVRKEVAGPWRHYHPTSMMRDLAARETFEA